jgi:hypothetical protein
MTSSDIFAIHEIKKKEWNSSYRRHGSKENWLSISQPLSLFYFFPKKKKKKSNKMRGGLGFLCVKWGKETADKNETFDKNPKTTETVKLLPRELKSMKSIFKLLC